MVGHGNMSCEVELMFTVSLIPINAQYHFPPPLPPSPSPLPHLSLLSEVGVWLDPISFSLPLSPSSSLPLSKWLLGQLYSTAN